MSEYYPGRWRCRECGHVARLLDMLTAPNPFADTDEVRGCPKCKACEPGWIELCDECDNQATCGIRPRGKSVAPEAFAAALERLRAERDEWERHSQRHAQIANKQAGEIATLRNERDTLRDIVRAADAMRLHSLILLGMPGGYADYDRARAKVVIP